MVRRGPLLVAVIELFARGLLPAGFVKQESIALDEFLTRSGVAGSIETLKPSRRAFQFRRNSFSPVLRKRRDADSILGRPL